MKFTRPINREVDIDGNTFIVSLDESGIGFRLKGKRRVARLEWGEAFEIARGEQGASARDYLGMSGAEPRQASEEAAPQTGVQREMPATQIEEGFQPQSQEPMRSEDEELSRTLSATPTGNE
jgi:hypothetical protein